MKACVPHSLCLAAGRSRLSQLIQGSKGGRPGGAAGLVAPFISEPFRSVRPHQAYLRMPGNCELQHLLPLSGFRGLGLGLGL